LGTFTLEIRKFGGFWQLGTGPKFGPEILVPYKIGPDPGWCVSPDIPHC